MWKTNERVKKKKIEIISKKQVTLPYLCELLAKGGEGGGQDKTKIKHLKDPCICTTHLAKLTAVQY